MRHILSDDLVDSAVRRYWTRFLGFASWLGHLTTAVIGFWMIGKIVKFLIDTVIHGRILYDIYGCGWQLIAALWDSLTSLLTHKYMQARQQPPEPEDVTVPIKEPEPAIRPPMTLEEAVRYPKLPTAPKP